MVTKRILIEKNNGRKYIQVLLGREKPVWHLSPLSRLVHSFPFMFSNEHECPHIWHCSRVRLPRVLSAGCIKQNLNSDNDSFFSLSYQSYLLLLWTLSTYSAFVVALMLHLLLSLACSHPTQASYYFHSRFIHNSQCGHSRLRLWQTLYLSKSH